MKKLILMLMFVMLIFVLLPSLSWGASATLSWDPPTTNEDGTTLTDLAGYNIHYGLSSGNYNTTINAGNVTTYEISNLPIGTYYFVVTAYDTSSNESEYSNEVNGEVTSMVIPNAPTNVKIIISIE